MRSWIQLLLAALLFLVELGIFGATAEPSEAAQVIRKPTKNRLYHGDFPGIAKIGETQISVASQQSYVSTVEKSVAWVYFSNDWFRGVKFPLETARWIRQRGSVPYIRLNIRSSMNGLPETKYTLNRIIRGDFDSELRSWARTARNFNYPLIVEYGWEMNGRWEPWNGFWNGRAHRREYGNHNIPDGAERYVDAYRHIVDLMREEKAYNITWVFHANDRTNPNTNWNYIKWYYPGAGYVDWLAVSVYGPQTPTEPYNSQFAEAMDKIYPRITKLAPNKPVIVAEMGCINGRADVNQADWASRALGHLIADRWPKVIGFSWWNNGLPGSPDTGRVEDNPDLARVFQNNLRDERVLGRPIFAPRKE